jgi:hypothetical protein
MTKWKLDKEHILQDMLSSETEIIPLLNPTEMEEVKNS